MTTYTVTATPDQWTQLTQGELKGSYLVLKGEIFVHQAAAQPTSAIKDTALTDYINSDNEVVPEPRAFFAIPEGEYLWVRTRDRAWTDSDGDGSVTVHVTGGE